MPLILGLMPILPKHAIDPETFDKSTLTPPIGSGPYTVAEVGAPNYIVFKRNPDYWAKDLPIQKGLYNYDEIRIDYYRDANTMFEAFKKGLYQINPEGDPAQWNTAYDFPALKEGRVVKETFHTGTPKGMSGFVFNTRRPIFADIAVRRALAKAFDFAWVNKNLYYDAFDRAAGYFNDSELSSIGVPASDREKAAARPLPRRRRSRGDGRNLPAGLERRLRRRPDRAPRGTVGASGRRLRASRQRPGQHRDRESRSPSKFW